MKYDKYCDVKHIQTDMPDWSLILVKLRKSFGSYMRIGRCVNSTGHYLSKLARNEISDPRWNTGNRILALYEEIYGAWPKK